jgi:hypothetical protein
VKIGSIFHHLDKPCSIIFRYLHLNTHGLTMANLVFRVCVPLSSLIPIPNLLLFFCLYVLDMYISRSLICNCTRVLVTIYMKATQPNGCEVFCYLYLSFYNMHSRRVSFIIFFLIFFFVFISLPIKPSNLYGGSCEGGFCFHHIFPPQTLLYDHLHSEISASLIQFMGFHSQFHSY